MSMEGGLIQPHHGMEDSALHMDTEPSADEDEKMIKELDASGELVACDEGGADLEPYEGMEFESEETARTFYDMYATRLGFRTRISRYTRSRRDNSIISRRIVCSKEGFREDRPMQGLIGGERRQRHRAVTRVGCKAMITVKKTSTGKWAITKFVKEHNHGPVPPRKVEVRIVRKEEEVDDTLIERSLVSSGVNVVPEPYEGMEFDSEEAAKSYYSTYASHMGFRARISKYCRSRRDNSIISRQIVCSKEGFREIRAKEMTDEGKLKRPRVVTRIGCKAMIIVKKLNSGKWAVSKFDREHNHALVPPKNVSLLRSDSTTGEGSITYLQGASSVPSGVVTGGCYAGIQETSQESLAVLYNQLYCESIKYAQEGAATVESYNVAMSALREAVEKVAAAKKGAVTGGATTNQDVTIGQGTNNLMIPVKALHDLKGSNYAKQAIATQELMLLQRPISFVLIPSTSPNDSDHAKQPVDAPVILNVTTNSQMVRNPTDSLNMVCSSQEMNMEQPLTSVEGFVCSDLPAGRKGRMQKTDADTKNHAVKKSKVKSSSSSLISPGFSEAKMVAIPALPVTLYMPVIGSLPETRSVTTPGSSYTLAPALEARPVPAHPMEAAAQSEDAPHQIPVEASQSGPSTSAAAPSDETKQYTGGSPNPRVHATAIAAGARIVPPKAAASVINAIEARIRSARISLAQTASPSGCKVSAAAAAEAWIPQSCDSGEGERVPRGSRGHEGGSQVPSLEDVGLHTSKEFDVCGSMTMIPRGRELVDTPGSC